MGTLNWQVWQAKGLVGCTSAAIHVPTRKSFLLYPGVRIGDMVKQKYYAVYGGREGTQIYETWDDVRPLLTASRIP